MTLKFGVEPTDLSQAGWGVIFAKDTDPKVRRALAPLLEHRRTVAGSVKSHYYQEYTARRGYQASTSTQQFLAKHGAGAEFVDPDKMPYYLLLVGSPEEIPFHFQYQLGARYAVGRIHFDNLKDYESYAKSIVQAEKPRQVRLPRRLTFFGVENGGDGATRRGLRELIEPLARGLLGQVDGWEIEVVRPEDATRERLGRLLGGGEETPSLLFTHCHGMSFRPADERQEQLEGALVCRDWGGAGTRIRRQHYFAGEDVGDVSLLGMIVVHLACSSAGTPEWDNFTRRLGEGLDFGAPRQVWNRRAQRPFVAALPKRLMSRGTLAVVGQVDRVWNWSYSVWNEGSEVPLLKDMLCRLLAGIPVGHALEGRKRRWATLAADFSLALDYSETSAHSITPQDLGRMWTVSTDARNLIILGDPAVRVLGDGGRRRGRR